MNEIGVNEIGLGSVSEIGPERERTSKQFIQQKNLIERDRKQLLKKKKIGPEREREPASNS